MRDMTKYSSAMTVDSQFNASMEANYAKYGETMMRIEGVSTKDLDTCQFFKNFLEPGVVANATIDDNANVTSKNVSVMLSEAMKPHKKMLSRNKIYTEMKEAFGKEVADQFLEEAINGAIYEHDSHISSYMPYCYAFSLEKIVENGLFFISEMKAGRPKHWDTFNHHVLEFAAFATNMMAGAVGIPDYLVYAYYFYHEDTKDMDETTRDRYRNQKFQEFIYSLNQPYAKSGVQSIYSNLSILDMDHLAKFFNGKKYPDGSLILSHIDEIKEFQQYFLDFIGELRQEKWHTFPVLSASLIFNETTGDFADTETAKMVIGHNHKFGFNDVNIMPAKEVTSAASCCRLVSNIKELKGATFNSIGGSDLNVGSTKVVTINLARLALNYKYHNEAVYNIYKGRAMNDLEEGNTTIILYDLLRPIFDELQNRLDIIYKYHYAQRNSIKKMISKGMLPLYTSGMMSLETQFATIGINGLYECISVLGGIEEVPGVGMRYNDLGYLIAEHIFKTINENNEKTMDKYGYMTNVEQVPAESAAIKLSKKDRTLFGDMFINETLGEESYIYANQWIPLKETASVFDRIDAAAKLDDYCGGGAILHINLGENFNSLEDAYKFTTSMAKKGVKYFSYISKISICANDHSFFGEICPICEGPKVSEGIKVVGYLVKTQSYKKERINEFNQRKFHKQEELIK